MTIKNFTVHLERSTAASDSIIHFAKLFTLNYYGYGTSYYFLCLKSEFGRLLSSEKSCPAFNYFPGGKYRKLAWTTSLAYRIVINSSKIGLKVSTSLL